jgi:hypothetical protein
MAACPRALACRPLCCVRYRLTGIGRRAGADRLGLRPRLPARLHLRGSQARREARQRKPSRIARELSALSWRGFVARSACEWRDRPGAVRRGAFACGLGKGQGHAPADLRGFRADDPAAGTSDHRSDIRSLADFRSADRIAVPARSAPQFYLLQMQSEKVFGQYDKLRAQIVVLSHAEAVNDLVGAKDSVRGYFSSAPYTEIALADGRVHKILSASDVIDGKASFLILGASKGYIASHPKVPEAIAKAIDEAARIIRDDPHRAAEIYLDDRCRSACRRTLRLERRIR